MFLLKIKLNAIKHSAFNASIRGSDHTVGDLLDR